MREKKKLPKPHNEQGHWVCPYCGKGGFMRAHWEACSARARKSKSASA